MEIKTLDVRKREILSKLCRLARQTMRSVNKYLDLGCGDGSLTLEVADIFQCSEVWGVDIDENSLKCASMRGIKVLKVNLNTQKVPLPDKTFELVTAFDVIEHLWNTDNLISEAYRLLKRGGYFILTTPNLASWINRTLLLFGYLPFHYEVSPKYNLEKRPLQKSYGVEGHIRLYTLKTLIRHLRAYGFSILEVHGINLAYAVSNSIVRLINSILSWRKSLAPGMLVITIKK